MISGSRAIERARATRLRIPPESSDGIFFWMPGRPTMVSFSATRAATSGGVFSVCSRTGKAMLSSTFIESKSAPPWNNMASRRRTGESSSSEWPTIDSPKTRTSPLSGRVSPLMWRSVTLFPVPDGPRMQRTSPRWIFRFTPASTARPE